MADATTPTTGTETTETTTPTQITIIPINTPIYQVSGGQTYKLLPETTAKQVKMGDGVDVETRVNTLERALAANTTLRFADDIAGRDALIGKDLIPGDIVVVADASADETVDSGGARYVYDTTGTFRKISEDESMDIVCSWEHLQDKPDSTPAQIDLAVAKQHVHDNIETIVHLSDDGENNLLFKGKRINDGKIWVSRVGSLADIPTNLADGGLVFVPTVAGEAGA